MNKPLILEPTSLAQWHALVEEARISAAIPLTEDLESYLIFLLMRFINHPEMATKILAIDYLKNFKNSKRENSEALKEIADTCLLFAGLFPGRAAKRRVKMTYYIDLGKGAYSSLALHQHHHLATLYHELYLHFVELMDVLHAVRELNKDAYLLNPLDAAELWSNTQSKHAIATLRKTTQGFIVPENLRNPPQKH